MDKPAIAVCEAFAKAGYPLDVEALLIVEVEGSEDEIADLLRDIVDIAKRVRPEGHRASATSAEQSARIWKGRKAAFGAIGPHLRLLLHGRHHPARRSCPRCWRASRRSAPSTASRSPTSSTPATATCIR